MSRLPLDAQRPVHERPLRQRELALAFVSTFSLVSLACASNSKNAEDVGSSDRVETTAYEHQDELGDDAEADVADEGDDAVEEPEYVEPPEAALARQALHLSAGKENHLGVAFTVYQRASDLPWILAIENRSPEPIQLGALPDLLHLTIVPPAPEPTPEAETQKAAEEQAPPGKATPKATQAAPKKEPEPLECGAGSLPKSLSDEEHVTLRPGELIFHSFDARDLCDGAEKALLQGARVEARYGFPLDTKKLWKAGKLETVEVEQSDPFVAKRKSESEEFVPLKHLLAEPFELGMTYPLAAVTPFPPAEQDAGEDAGESQGDGKAGDDQATEPPPPPPLTLSIAPLGTSSAPEDGNVQVTITNTSGKAMRLFVRRELVSYEVIGPRGAATCRMYPAERAPDSSAFRSLSVGGSTTLATRLAEACPKGTWDDPGTYSVSARFDANDSGKEHKLDAFVGTGVTTKPARLVVPGSAEDRRNTMRIVPSAPPKK